MVKSELIDSEAKKAVTKEDATKAISTLINTVSGMLAKHDKAQMVVVSTCEERKHATKEKRSTQNPKEKN